MEFPYGCALQRMAGRLGVRNHSSYHNDTIASLRTLVGGVCDKPSRLAGLFHLEIGSVVDYEFMPEDWTCPMSQLKERERESTYLKALLGSPPGCAACGTVAGVFRLLHCFDGLCGGQ